MDSYGAEGSRGRGKRHSSLPSSLIPLMYLSPRRPESASPSQLESSESTENLPSGSTQFTTTSQTPAFILRPIDALPSVPISDERRLPVSRLYTHLPDREQESQRAGPSSIHVETHREPRFGEEATHFVFQLPPTAERTSFTFPPVPRYTNLPYSNHGEGEVGSSTVDHASTDDNRRRAVTTMDPSATPVLNWPRIDHDRVEEVERRERIGDQVRYEDQPRQDQRSLQTRLPARFAIQQGETRTADLPTSVPTYLPGPAQYNPPVVPFQGLHLTHADPPVYHPNPYVSRTQSYTPIAPQHFPRYFDAPPMTITPSAQDLPSQQPVEYDYEPEKERSSATSRSRGKRRGRGPGDNKKRITPKEKRSRASIGDIEEDGTNKRPKKVPVACTFCRGRKLRCDGVKPTCNQCAKRHLEHCDYVSHIRRRGPGKAPKGSKKRKVVDIDPFTTMLDMSHTPGPSTGRADSVTSADTIPRQAPIIGGSGPSAYTLPPQSAPPTSHLPSQSPSASTSEREAGPSGERRQRRRTASQHDRLKRRRRVPETGGTDDTSHDPRDDDRPFEGRPPP